MRATVIAISAALVALVVISFVMRDTAAPALDIDPTSTPASAARNLTTPKPQSATSPNLTPSPTSQPTAPPATTHAPASLEAIRYQAAITACADGKLLDAIDHFEHVIAKAGPLAPFARLRFAQALLTAGEHLDAAAAFEEVLTNPGLPAIFYPRVLTEGAASLAATDRVDEAITWLTNAATHPDASDAERTAATWERALHRLQLDDPLWATDALATISSAPGSTHAADAIAALDAAGEDTPPLAAAYSQYLARENIDATKRYETIRDEAIAAGDNATAAIAAFYLGALAERIAGRVAAIDTYSDSLEFDSLGSFAADAAYWRGRVAEERADFELAASSYNLVLNSYPSSRFATDAALRGALTIYQAGNEFAGLEDLAAIAKSTATTNATAARWYDLLAGPAARIAAGIPAPADLDVRSLGAVLATRTVQSGDAPPSELIAELFPNTLAPSESAADTENTEAIATWLLDRFGADLPATQGITTDTALWGGTIPALLEANEHSLARTLAITALNLVSENDPAQISIALRARELGLHDISLIATLRVVGDWSTAQRLATPLAVERLGYPSPWTAGLEAAAIEFAVPPLLLLALVRQESAFNPQATSLATAVGLTQVIPSTGALIAASLGEDWDGSDSLTNPEISLRYGAAYLAAQLESFDGNIYAALAAYNGGPSNAHRWLDKQQLPDADGFVQVIDFEETRRYVATVVEQFAWYRYVYGLADIPSLP